MAAPLIKYREASLAGADGVVGSSHRLSVVEPTTPSAPSEEASRHFIDVASTPPRPRGGMACLKHWATIHHTSELQE